MNIPLVADISKRIAEDYGVLVIDEEDEMYGAALRGLFIIDPEGIIRSIQINDDAVGRSVDEALRLLKAFSTLRRIHMRYVLRTGSLETRPLRRIT
uniref:Alkyl hydroperoxide reductase subunit C/ Thiol specific antioxidant domain-containing protein n=1 Tax=Hyaloperonospora arabidopsidis (strain Emoy2) TaxID=559515 RepID=M4BIH5_HYAAE